MVIQFNGFFFIKVLKSLQRLNYANFAIYIWQEDDFFIGFLNDYPSYETQSYSKAELIENLKSLLSDIESNEIPFIRKVEELAIA